MLNLRHAFFFVFALWLALLINLIFPLSPFFLRLFFGIFRLATRPVSLCMFVAVLLSYHHAVVSIIINSDIITAACYWHHCVGAFYLLLLYACVLVITNLTVLSQ